MDSPVFRSAVFGGQRIGSTPGGVDIYTVLMLHMDGSDGSTAFTDSSMSAHTMTAGGSAQIDTAQSMFGGSSGLFATATNDYVAGSATSDTAFGTGAFTVDFRLRPTSVSAGTYESLFDTRDSGSGGYLTIFKHNDTVTAYDGAYGNLTVSGSILAADTWAHFAVVFDPTGPALTLYADGTATGTPYTGTPRNFTRTGLIIGGSLTTAQFFDGWIDEFRVSKGIARWTSNFTPPTSAYS